MAQRGVVAVIIVAAACGGTTQPVEPPATAPPSDAAPAPADAVVVAIPYLEVDDAAPVTSDMFGSIRDVIRAALPTFRRCPPTEPATVAEPVKLTFTIGPDGTVVDAVALGLGPAVDACMLAAMRALVFAPRPDGGSVRVSYPFNVDAR